MLLGERMITHRDVFDWTKFLDQAAEERTVDVVVQVLDGDLYLWRITDVVAVDLKEKSNREGGPFSKEKNSSFLLSAWVLEVPWAPTSSIARWAVFFLDLKALVEYDGGFRGPLSRRI